MHLHVRRVGIGHRVRTRVEIRPTPRQSHDKHIIQPYTKQRFIGYFIDYRDEGRSGTLLLIGGGASLTILFLIQRADTAAREHLVQDRMLRTNSRLLKESRAFSSRRNHWHHCRGNTQHCGLCRELVFLMIMSSLDMSLKKLLERLLDTTRTQPVHMRLIWFPHDITTSINGLRRALHRRTLLRQRPGQHTLDASRRLSPAAGIVAIVHRHGTQRCRRYAGRYRSIP